MTYTIQCDAATEGANGKLGTVKYGGVGFFCIEKNASFSRRIPCGSSNEAEFFALILAMRWAVEKRFQSVVFQSDSRIVINRANGARAKGKHKNERMDNLQDKVFLLKEFIPDCSFVWIPREENSKADSLSRLRLEKSVAI